jgi:hypothetical protein
MSDKLNKIAQYEKAISKQYGEKSIDNPQKEWSDEKEKEYQQQLKELYQKEDLIQKKKDKVEVDGVLISKKLFNKDSNRNCQVCSTYSFDIRDDIYMTKFDCCFNCYIQWVEGREERWRSGWRPKKENK